MKIKYNERLYIEMLEEQLAEQSRYVDEIRGVKHDMQAHMIVLYHYLEKNEFDKAKNYLSKVMRIPLFCGAPVIDMGHDLVNAIVSSKIRHCAVPIELDTSGLFPEQMAVEDIDLCVLFSNLISNSVEACEKLKDTNRVVSIEIDQEKEDLHICIKNPIEWTVNPDILGKDTTKADKESHGYGIRNVQAIVEKYSGKIEFEITGSLFLVKIILHNVVKAPLIC